MSTVYHPRLSLDIILAIIPILDQPTALVVSAANRELRAHAPFILLQKPVRLWSDRGIVSFNAFIRENGSFIPHCQQVHDLDITLSSSFPSAHLQRLKDILDTLTGLRSLTIRNLEVVLSQSFSFRRVLEGIKHLEVFSIETVGPTTVKFLRTSRAKFQSIRVLDPIWRFPADALAGFECEDLFAYDCQVPPAPTPSHYSFVLPELSRLHIPRFFLESGVGHRAGFMYLAPNLSVLDVGTEYSARPWTDELLAHPRDNKAATVRFQIAVAEHQRQPVWTQLDVVRGGLVDLLLFGNTCRADALELVGAPVADPALQWFIPQVVLDNEPRILRFSLAGPEFEMGGFVAQPVCLASVESLHVKVVLTSEAEWTACEVSPRPHPSRCFWATSLRALAPMLTSSVRLV